MQSVVEWIQSAPEQALIVLGSLLVATFLLPILTLVRVGKVAEQQKRLLTGLESGDLEKLLGECLTENKILWTQLDTRRRAEEALGERLGGTYQKLGLVRYDAVANAGGQQSFSLALLDGSGSGIVLSGLQTRAEMRVYAKPVSAGSSPQTLTDEEKQAIEQALKPAR
jgi:hypothetical protein